MVIVLDPWLLELMPDLEGGGLVKDGSSGAVGNDQFCSTACQSASFVFLKILHGRDSRSVFPGTFRELSGNFP